MTSPRLLHGFIAAPLLLLAGALPHARAADAATGNAQAGAAKAAACAACHGPQGVSAVPTFPSLAGLPAGYVATQLKDYKSGSRKDPMMSAAAAGLAAADLGDVAAYYASLAPKAAGHPDASSRGGTLYLKGDPAQGVPACQGCHGPAGEGPQPHGSSSLAGYPRVAGQPQAYLAKVLNEYKQGSRAGTDAKVMQGVLQNVGESDINALAAYISTQ